MEKFDFTNRPELYNSRFYRTWSNMKTRCSNKKVREFNGYGGRGIQVCDKWQTFGGFFDDMYPNYLIANAEKLDLTLDRIDNNKGYSKDNCRWATKTEQARNTRNIDRATKVTYKGETKTIREWSEFFGIKRTTLDMRINKYGWEVEKAFTK